MVNNYRIISEDPTTGFIYYQHRKSGHVYYYGGFAGKRSGLFGDKGYWDYMLTMPNSSKVFGPFQFLDQIVPTIIEEM